MPRSPRARLIRRFGQIIRQAGHFGKRLLDVNTGHRIRTMVRSLEAMMLPGVKELIRETRRGLRMIDFNSEAKTGRIVTVFFALLTSVTAVSAAIVPAIVHI